MNSITAALIKLIDQHPESSITACATYDDAREGTAVTNTEICNILDGMKLPIEIQELIFNHVDLDAIVQHYTQPSDATIADRSTNDTYRY